jgi:hypothetical protein
VLLLADGHLPDQLAQGSDEATLIVLRAGSAIRQAGRTIDGRRLDSLPHASVPAWTAEALTEALAFPYARVGRPVDRTVLNGLVEATLQAQSALTLATSLLARLDETDAAKPRIGPREPGRPYDEAQAGNHDLILEWGRDNGVEVFFMQYPIMDEYTKYGCMTGKDELPAGARIIPACDRITESGLPARDLFQDRNHLTEIGNQIVGKIVADSLREWADERAAEK